VPIWLFLSGIPGVFPRLSPWIPGLFPRLSSEAESVQCVSIV
jgi:hypothetical protein